jgi:hypothetical protein
MKDYLGNELNISDNVVYVELKYRNFDKAVISRFTEHYVFIKTREGLGREIKQKPEQLIKI